MPVATARSIRVRQGAAGHLVEVPVDLSQGAVETGTPGPPDALMIGARDRCRAASTYSGIGWPGTCRVTTLERAARVG